MPAVPASACIGEYIVGHRSETERIVEFPVREKAALEETTDPRRSTSSLRISLLDSPARFGMTQNNMLTMLADSGPDENLHVIRGMRVKGRVQKMRN
jgi:hypothetical protein